MERHHLDVLSLFAGLFFVLIAVLGLTDAVQLSLTDLRWLGPAALVGFGIVLVLTAGGGRRRTADREATDPDDDEDVYVAAGDDRGHDRAGG